MVSYAKHSFQRIKSFAYGAKNRIRIENSMKTTFKRNAQQSWVRISLTRGAKCCNNLYLVDKEKICCRPFLIFNGVIYGLSSLYSRYLIGAVSILTVRFWRWRFWRWRFWRIRSWLFRWWQLRWWGFLCWPIRLWTYRIWRGIRRWFWFCWHSFQ
mgnify:CR=1 FL=1